jgi:porphobilinogen synthase
MERIEIASTPPIESAIASLRARPRRLRLQAALRRMVRETQLTANDLIYPLFVRPGRESRPVPSMPGVRQLSIEDLLREAEAALRLGIPAVLLFGIPEHKDPFGSESYAEEGIIQRALRALKRTFPELVVITDLCFCEYTDHGHCGLLDERGQLDNDATLRLLAQQALSHARAGADVLAPSGMLDGMVAVIRAALDEAGYTHIPILSYAVKYASAFYGPFRQAAESAPAFGDRRTHQMDPANAEEALREVALDLEQGADMVMVKPAGPYLDVIRRIKDRFPVPLAAYQVSGEYAMLKAAALQGWLEERTAVSEALLAIKRAGADMIITYYAQEALEKGWLAG